MNDLIEKLEAATEGSRELEMEIGILLGWKAPHIKYAEWGMWLSPGGESEQLPWFTTSLDSALTLVPEGWSLANLYDAVDPKDRPWVGAILRRDEPYYKVPENIRGAPTYALALCIAALKARSTSPDSAPIPKDQENGS